MPPEPGGDADGGRLVRLQMDVGQGVLPPRDPVPRLGVEDARGAGLQGYAQLAQLSLVPLELALERLVVLGVVRVVLVPGHGRGDLRGGQEPPRGQQADHQVDQALGADARHALDASSDRACRHTSRAADWRRGLAHRVSAPGRRGALARWVSVGGIRWRSGTVTQLGRRWRGAAELSVRVGSETLRALAYPALVGEPAVGDRVLLNVTALHLGLGTGGYALVVALPDRLPPDPDGPGHVVKARYTPLQAVVLAADEESSPHRSVLAAAESLDGMPVVTAGLHSAVPAILAGIHERRPDARVGYVMTDGGALPAWFSLTLDALAGRLAGTVTTGQAFGGDLEATNVHS